MKEKIDRIDILSVTIYVLALTAARDEEGTREEDKEALKMIRDYMNELLILRNGNPNMVVYETAGMSESEGIKLGQEIKEDK